MSSSREPHLTHWLTIMESETIRSLKADVHDQDAQATSADSKEIASCKILRRRRLTYRWAPWGWNANKWKTRTQSFIRQRCIHIVWGLGFEVLCGKVLADFELIVLYDGDSHHDWYLSKSQLPALPPPPPADMNTCFLPSGRLEASWFCWRWCNSNLIPCFPNARPPRILV